MSHTQSVELTSETTPSAEMLRSEMAQVRHELSEDVDDVVENAKELTDWRHYVRKYPFVCVGAALAVGYLVVPQRIEIVSPSAKQIEKLAKRDHLVVKHSPNAGPASPGWKSKLLTFGANLLLRSAITYAGQQAGKLLGEQQAQAVEQSQGMQSQGIGD